MSKIEQKKYMSITRLGHRSTKGVLNKGDRIVVQEKLDGANASIVKIDGEVKCFSRNHELSEEKTLDGFYEFANSLDLEELNDGFVLFGEWLTKHKVIYPEEIRKTFWLYDIYDKEKNEYMSFDTVRAIGIYFGLNVVPVLFEGEYESFEQLESFVGETKVGGTVGGKTQGEGIVVKRPEYRDRYGNQIFVKLVTQEFAEIQKQKLPKDPSIITPEQKFANAVMTDARIEKHLHKLVDEGLIHEEWGIEDMGVILKNLSQRLHDDIMKEESDMLMDFCGDDEPDVKRLRKAVSRACAISVKKIIDNSKK